MIEIVVTRDKLGNPEFLSVQGHSHSGSKGNNIVCAAVSVLMENLEAGITLLLRQEIDIIKKDGFHSMDLAGTNRDVALLAESTILGLRTLRQKYAKDLSIIEN